MEASRLASVGERLSRLEEASRKREETNAAFISATQAALEDKLDATSSNREAYLNGLRAKITDHVRTHSEYCIHFATVDLQNIIFLIYCIYISDG